jgi:serine/threonine protein kinase
VKCPNCPIEVPDFSKCPLCGEDLGSLLRPGTVLHGKYEIEYALGRGGFGITYRAIHSGLSRPVAIKEFFPEQYAYRVNHSAEVKAQQADDKPRSFQRALSRFQREGRILSKVRHPNVVQATDVFTENGTAYLVMEYVHGETLKSVMKKRTLTPSEIEGITASLVAALSATHDARVFHLDIKPTNVMVQEDGKVVLIDFGAARQEPFSTSSMPLWTPHYAPLEVMSATKIGPASDIFSLGVLLHEMWTGTLPPNPQVRMYSGLNFYPVDSIVPEPWNGLLEQALRLRYEDRPQDVELWWVNAMQEAILPPGTAWSRVWSSITSGWDMVRRRMTALWNQHRKPTPSSYKQVYLVRALVTLLILTIPGVYWTRTSFNRPSDKSKPPIGQPISASMDQNLTGVNVMDTNRPVAQRKYDSVKKVEVPDVRLPMAIADARRTLEAKRLRIGTVSYRYDPVVTEGIVLEQSIIPGFWHPVGTRIHLIVSKGVAPQEEKKQKRMEAEEADRQWSLKPHWY